MHNKNPKANFSGGDFIFLPHIFLYGRKNVKFYYCHSIGWCILAERMRETEKNAASVGHICQEEEDTQISKIGTAHAQFCFSATFQRLQLNHYLTLSNMQ